MARVGGGERPLNPLGCRCWHFCDPRNRREARVGTGRAAKRPAPFAPPQPGGGGRAKGTGSSAHSELHDHSHHLSPPRRGRLARGPERSSDAGRPGGGTAGPRGSLPAASGLEVSEMVCTSNLCLVESRARVWPGARTEAIACSWGW